MTALKCSFSPRNQNHVENANEEIYLFELSEASLFYLLVIYSTGISFMDPES